jgi:hypothetical protein
VAVIGMQKGMSENGIPFISVGMQSVWIKHVFGKESLIPEPYQGENNIESEDIIGYHVTAFSGILKSAFPERIPTDKISFFSGMLPVFRYTVNFELLSLLSMRPEKGKEIIGRTVFVDLPRLGFTAIPAKTDTGAYYCSLHCHFIKVTEEEGKPVLCFNLLDPSHPEYQERAIYYRKKFIEKQIKNSFGDTEKRYLIRTAIRIQGRRIKAWISLTDRGSMKYPMLLGSRLLRNKFVVDVSLKAEKPI